MFIFVHSISRFSSLSPLYSCMHHHMFITGSINPIHCQDGEVIQFYPSAMRARTTFGSWDVEKVHAVVARSSFPSQNVQSTRGFGPLFDDQMSKKCTPFWRKAHFQVKMHKARGGSDHFLTIRCRKSARRSGAKHISKSKCIALHYATLQYTTLHYTTPHYTTPTTLTLHHITLHYTTLHYIKLLYITLHCTILSYIIGLEGKLKPESPWSQWQKPWFPFRLSP